MAKGLIYYNTSEFLYFEIDTYDTSFPLFAVVLDFITGQGGVY